MEKYKMSNGKICPKCHYQRKPDDDDFYPEYECPKCGIIYDKFIPPEQPTASNNKANGIPNTKTVSNYKTISINIKKIISIIIGLVIGLVILVVSAEQYQQFKLARVLKHYDKVLIECQEKGDYESAYYELNHSFNRMVIMGSPVLTNRPLYTVEKINWIREELFERVEFLLPKLAETLPQGIENDWSSIEQLKSHYNSFFQKRIAVLIRNNAIRSQAKLINKLRGVVAPKWLPDRQMIIVERTKGAPKTRYNLIIIDTAMRKYFVESGMTPEPLTRAVFKEVLNRSMPSALAKNLIKKLDNGSLKLQGNLPEYRIGIHENDQWIILRGGDGMGEIHQKKEF